MSSIFSSNKKQALSAVLEVLIKGIDLITNNSLDKDLYEAFEKYAISTVKMVDSAYVTNYALRFDETYINCFSYKSPLENYLSDAIFNNRYSLNSCISKTNLMEPLYNQYYPQKDTSYYEEKLKNLLQKITVIVKEITTM